MRKLLLIGALFMIVLSGCAKDEEVLNVQSSAKVIQMLEDDATVVVVIGQTTCAACIQYKPVLEELLTNYDFELVYVEIDLDKRDDLAKLVDNHLIVANATPTTYVFIEGEQVDMVVGYMDYRATKAFFEKNKIIE